MMNTQAFFIDGPTRRALFRVGELADEDRRAIEAQGVTIEDGAALDGDPLAYRLDETGDGPDVGLGRSRHDPLRYRTFAPGEAIPGDHEPIDASPGRLWATRDLPGLFRSLIRMDTLAVEAEAEAVQLARAGR